MVGQVLWKKYFKSAIGKPILANQVCKVFSKKNDPEVSFDWEDCHRNKKDKHI